MGTARCKWVRGRLPLLVGDDLRGLDRRRVERHLIGCPECRQHQTALGQVLTTLRTAAASPPATPDAPSLWPALARQIRESRRPSPTPSFGFAWPFPFASALGWLRVNGRPWPALGLGLGLLATVGIGLGVRHKHDQAQAQIAANRNPIPGWRTSPTVLVDDVSPAPIPGSELPGPADTQVVESPPPPRMDFDLDHLRPMPETRESRDIKATY